MMYYYNESNIDASVTLEKYGCNELSPALVYAASSIEDILNEIRRGIIPVNTGEPFPVVWGKDAETDINSAGKENKPNFIGSNSQFVNPLEDILKL